MSETYQSLSHSRWDCKYHVIFVPKWRRKALFGNIRNQLSSIFYELARQKECRIIEDHLLSDHVHMCITIPPNHAIASVIGSLKGKSAIAITHQFGGRGRNFAGEHFWARGFRCLNRRLRARGDSALHRRAGRRRRAGVVLVVAAHGYVVKEQRAKGDRL
jgi:putative transposase